MGIGERLRNSYKLKVAADMTRGVLSWPDLLHRRVVLGRRLRAMPEVRIHLGCGRINDPRFLNVDARPFPHVHYVTKSPLMKALPAECGQMIYACHVFEHIPYVEQMLVLRRWYALLKRGGELLLSVPDFEKIVGMHQRRETKFTNIQGFLMGGQGYRENFHYALFTADHLTMLLTKAGFTQVSHWHPKDRDNWPKDWSWGGHVSLNLRALKP